MGDGASRDKIMTDDEDEKKEQRISGKDATNAALDAKRYPPVKIEASGDTKGPAEGTRTESNIAKFGDGADNALLPAKRRNPPPRVRKPSPSNEQYLAPTNDIEGHHARLREAFGNTMSDEFVQVMLGKLVEALKPNPFDELQEATFNAALAMLHSAHCQSELQAFVAVEIVATGFAGLRFVRQSQRHMTEEYISVYGNYAQKLLRMQIDLMQTLERMQRGGKPSFGIGHVEIHPGAQVVGIVQGAGEEQRDPTGRER